ncbi:MAG TPA: alpha/beta hydrolase, partial [Candidatus Polarisedimenticolia bacterium]|nr:alpha/beta hydrolase [Candidatus Polarisedimenticolia bacterium]
GAILLEGAFTSVPDVGRHAFPFLPVAWLLRSRFDNLAAIGKVSAPTLFIHGSRDEVIPLSMARRLFDASPAQLKRLREVAGAGHNTVWLEEAPALYEEIAGFLSDARITR